VTRKAPPLPCLAHRRLGELAALTDDSGELAALTNDSGELAALTDDSGELAALTARSCV